jgi:DNA-binding FadR family transcriptional regulator
MDHPEVAPEWLEARWAVEMMVVELAAKRATDEDIRFQRETLQSFLAGPQTAAQFVAVDTKCQLGIARAARNERLYQVMEAHYASAYSAIDSYVS